MSTRAHTVPRFYLNGFVADASAKREQFVWLASLKGGEIVRRSPKNISISRGLYDGPGAFSESGARVESHLSKIESAASFAIRRVANTIETDDASIPAEIWRFLAWQAARTPGWMELVQRWANEPPGNPANAVIEPPPVGFECIGNRIRPLCIENPETGEHREVVEIEEFDAYRRRGWKWILRRDDHLEALHVQAWYFLERHFPRLSWTRLLAPQDTCFITSDRAVGWLVDGYADTPPAALRDPAAQIVAPLTKTLALVGRHGIHRLNVTPRQVNRFVAFAASEWIAGPTREAVAQALSDRFDQ